MNIIDKDFTTTKTAVKMSLELKFEQLINGSVTAIGVVHLYDANDVEVHTIEQPLSGAEIAKFNTQLGGFKTWILAQNSIVLE